MIARASAPGLDVGAAPLVVQAPLPFGFRHPRLVTRLGPMRRLLHERHQPRKRFGAIAFLGAVLVGADDDFTFLCEASSGQTFEALAHLVGHWRVTAETEAQLHRRRHLVDVLAARARGPDKALFKVAFVQGEGGGDRNHAPQH